MHGEFAICTSNTRSHAVRNATPRTLSTEPKRLRRSKGARYLSLSPPNGGEATIGRRVGQLQTISPTRSCLGQKYSFREKKNACSCLLELFRTCAAVWRLPWLFTWTTVRRGRRRRGSRRRNFDNFQDERCTDFQGLRGGYRGPTSRAGGGACGGEGFQPRTWCPPPGACWACSRYLVVRWW